MILLTIFAAAASWSSPPTDLVHPDELSAYNSWLNQEELSEAAKTAGSGCTDVTPISGRVLGDKSILHLSNDSVLEGPVYRESFVLNGCGITAKQNIVVLRLHVGGWKGIVGLPGETIASPLLQRDAYRQAALVARLGLPPTCSAAEQQASYKVSDTKVLSRPQHGVIGSGWQELWIQSACNLDRSVKVTFTLTSDGGADFAVSPAWPRTPAPANP